MRIGMKKIFIAMVVFIICQLIYSVLSAVLYSVLSW